MLVVCWSVKGGSGTTVTAVALALCMARSGPVRMVDLRGDVPAVLGLSEPSNPGIWEVVGLGDDAPIDALARTAVPVIDNLSVVPSGQPLQDCTQAHSERLVALLRATNQPIVVDAGVLGVHAAATLAAVADRSLLVIRPCYLALRRATSMEVRPSGIVLVREPSRALGAADVSAVVGAPVVAELDVDPAVARLVDAGLLASRLPRRIGQALKDVA
jgi:cellulose biosynthesis protein BcsQ